MYIIEYGELEVFTECEGNEFIIERLPTGSVLNWRSIFTADNMVVNIRASKPSYLISFHEDLFQNLHKVDAKAQKNMQFYENELLKAGKTYPLDYIVCRFNEHKYEKYMIDRRTILKNIVMLKI